MTATLSWSRRILKTLSIAIQFRTVVLAVEIDEPTTKKLRMWRKRNASQFNFIIASCLIFPINVCKFVFFFFYEKLIKMRGDYVLICEGDK